MPALGLPGVSLFVPGQNPFSSVTGADHSISVVIKVARGKNAALQYRSETLFVRDPVVQRYAKLPAFFYGEIVVLQCGFSVPKGGLFGILFCADAVFTEPGKVTLSVPVAVVGGAACPP